MSNSNPLSPSHYSRYKIQPLNFLSENEVGFLEGNIIKYVLRYDAKNGVEDLKKAQTYLTTLIARETAKEKQRSLSNGTGKRSK